MGCASSSRAREIGEEPTRPSLPKTQSPESTIRAHSPSPSTIIRINRIRGFNRPSSPSFDEEFKVLILGDSGVGKSSVSVAFVSGSVPGPLPATVGIDIVMKTIEIGGKKVQLQMYDPAGHERNWMRMPNFGLWKSANAVVLMYDVTSRESFSHCETWLEAVKSSAQTSAVVVLVGNKIDRSDERMVEQEEAARFGSENGLPYYETSAAECTGVPQLFESITRKMLERLEEEKT